MGPGLVDESGGREVDTLDCVQKIRATHQTGPRIGRLEVGQRRGQRGERIGLVLEAADGDARM